MYMGVQSQRIIVLSHKTSPEKITFFVSCLASLLSDVCGCATSKLWSDSCNGMSRLRFCANTVLSTVFIFFSWLFVFSLTFLLKHSVSCQNIYFTSGINRSQKGDKIASVARLADFSANLQILKFFRTSLQIFADFAFFQIFCG